MRPPDSISLFFSSICLLLSIADANSFELLCSSPFTADGTSFCVGVPIKCIVMLDPDLCIVGEDLIMDKDLHIFLNDSRTGSHEDVTFRSMQDNSTLTIKIDYVPMFNWSMIEVFVQVNLSTNCSFELTFSDLAKNTPAECLYPLIINVTYFDPYIPAYVRGGEPIQLTVELTANTSLKELAVFLDCHPALHLKNAVFYRLYDGNRSVHVEHYYVHPYNQSLLLGVVNMENETLYIDLCFLLQAYVLPESDIYFLFRVHYFVPLYNNNSFFQTLNIREVYTTPEVIIGNISFFLPYYDEIDHVEFTFPPHVGDPFVIELPITVPCVSTDLNMTLSIPEFISDNYTMFLINVTNITYELPENLIFITELCNYTDNEPHEHDHSCYVDYVDIAYDRPYVVEHQMEELGVDLLFIDFGPILYNLSCYNFTYYDYNCTYGEYIYHYGKNITCEDLHYWYHYECTDGEFIDYYGEVVTCEELQYWYNNYTTVIHDNCTTNCTCNCSCGAGEDQITVIVNGVVAPNLQCEEETYLMDERIQCFVCENQTLADNITWEVDHMKEISVAMEFTTEVDYVTIRDEDIAPVNSSTPAISIPINSFSGDAGDSYNLTFGVLHNFEYSSFTAYDLNYTFTVNEHLHPAPFMKICFSNGSGDPFICENHLFIGHTIVRNGFHPK